MMRTVWIGSSLLLVGVSAVGVGAGNTNAMKGSDTLFDLTTAIFAACPGVLGTYAGTGSGNGQAAMQAGTQQVAPMSRFINSGACSGAALPEGGRSDMTMAQGLVIGLDSIDIVASNTTITLDAGSPDGSPVTCNGDDNPTCDLTFEPTTGAAYSSAISTSAGTYTFNGWRDVLRVLLAGFDQNNLSTGAAGWAARDCNSPVRQAIANNYGSVFESPCPTTNGDTTGTCTAIRHFFRRDDFSGTTDTVTSLLNLPSVVNPETTVTIATAAAGGGVVTSTINNHTGANPFCNSVRPSFVFPTTSPQPTCLQGADATWDPTAATTPSGCTRESAVYRSTMQDNDPIRRTCVGTGAGAGAAEDNCSHSGDLGLVLTMNDIPEPNTGNTAGQAGDRYNTTPCVIGKIAAAPAPDVYDATTQLKVTARASTGTVLCPNGDVTNNLGACIVPATNAAPPNPQCLASKRTIPGTVIRNIAVPVIHPQTPALGDGRQYNQHLFANSGGSAIYQTNGYSTPLPATGAFFRIQENHSLEPGTARTCQFADMTDQIGCLVEASPCSLGYAGRGTLDSNPNTTALKLKAVSPDTLCIQAHFLYPMARKLYLNTLVGFSNVTSQELNLTGCETDLAEPSLGTPAGLITTNIPAAGFITLPTFVNLGEPFCEDFNEAMLCGAAANNDACQTPPGNLDAFPAFESACGDGNRDSYEDCDDGTQNGPPPALCSTTCRLNN